MELSGRRTMVDRLCFISDSEPIDDTSLFLPRTKAAILTASSSVVAIITYYPPPDTAEGDRVKRKRHSKIWKTGVIIECESNTGDDYVSTIIAPATLFNIPPHEVEIDVYLSDGKMYKGELLGCDFYYNIAAIIIRSDCPLPSATLRGLDDVTSTPETPNRKLCSRSNLFKVEHETEIMALSRYIDPPYELQVIIGVLGSRPFYNDNACKELFALEEYDGGGKNGGVVINVNGEVIGIMFDGFVFLPTNLLLRWWNHLKNFSECRQPWLGLEVINLHETDLDFLEKVAILFPNGVTGVVVTEVEEGSPAYCSGIEPDDVIVKCNDKLVRSKLEFFENMWDTAGKNVEMNVLRMSRGDQLNLTIGETTRDKFYKWSRPSCRIVST